MKLTKKELEETIWMSLGRISGLAEMIKYCDLPKACEKAEKIKLLVEKISNDLQLLKVDGTNRKDYQL